MKKKILGIFALGLTAVTACFAGTTYALFSASVRVNQGVSSAGIIKKSIYLCPNIWEVNYPTYYMHVWKDGGTAQDDLKPSKTVSITVSETNMECKVFEYDTVTYDRFLFYRLDGKISGSGYSSSASETYVLKNFATNTDIPLYQNINDSNHFIARNVALAANDTLKVFDGVNYYTSEHTWTGCGFTLGDNNNIVVTNEGTYTIDFYLSHNENNHIILTNEEDPYNFKWNQTANITYSDSYNVYKIVDWDGDENDTSGYSTSLFS